MAYKIKISKGIKGSWNRYTHDNMKRMGVKTHKADDILTNYPQKGGKKNCKAEKN